MMKPRTTCYGIIEVAATVGQFMSAGIVVGVIAGIVAIILLIWFISTWNRLVRLEENVNKSWSDIDVLLKQRYDMLPNSVSYTHLTLPTKA